jgi:hypothetical protein
MNKKPATIGEIFLYKQLRVKYLSTLQKTFLRDNEHGGKRNTERYKI